MIETFTPTVIFLWLGVFLPLLVGFVWSAWSAFGPRKPVVVKPLVFDIAAPEEPEVVLPRYPTLEEQLEPVRRTIAAKASSDEDDPYGLVFSVYWSCTPRHPELAAEVHAALARHEGTKWRMAAFEFDLRVVQRFELYGELDGFDFAGARERLRLGLIDHDEYLSNYAGYYAADLMAGGHLVDAYSRLVFSDALESTANLHWPRPEGHMALLEQLQRAEADQT